MASLLIVAVVGLTLVLWPATPAYSAPLAPDFSLPLVAGGHGSLSLRALHGHPILLSFFQSSCEPCQAEAPALRQAYHAYRSRGVIVLGVATLGDTAAAAQRFARDYHLPYPVVADEDQNVEWRYHVGGTPISYFLDAGGRVQGEVDGQLDAQAIRNGLAQAGAIRCDGCDAVARPIIENSTAAAMGNTLTADVIYQPVQAAPSLSLRDQRGALVTPVTLRGKVVALTFLSAACIEQCPLVGKALSRVRQALGKDAARFSIVVVSADPDADMPALSYSFAIKSGWQSADWHYLTGERATLAPVWTAYHVAVEAAPRHFAGRGLVHDAGLFLIDPRGNLRARYDTPFRASDVASSARALLSGS